MEGLAVLKLATSVADSGLQFLPNRMTVRELIAVELKFNRLVRNSSGQFLVKSTYEEVACPFPVDIRKALELHMVDISVEEAGRHTCLVEDLPELEDSLADLVDLNNEEACHTQGSGYRNNQREEEGAFHRIAHLEHSQVLVAGCHHEHTLAQVAVVAVEEELGHVVHMAQVEEAVRSLEVAADFCSRYRLVLDAERHSSV